MARYTSSSLSRREWIIEILKVLAPALIVMVAVVGVFIAGNSMHSSWDTALKAREAEVNEMSIEQLQTVAQVQKLKEEKKMSVGTVDMSRQAADDALAFEAISSMLSYSGLDAMEEQLAALQEEADEDYLQGLTLLAFLSDVQEASEDSASVSQTFDRAGFTSYLYSFDEDGTYYYYADVTGRREASGLLVGEDPYFVHSDFRWLMIYGITVDGEIVGLHGFEIV